MTHALVKGGNLDTETDTQGEHHVTMKAEMRVIHLQARECQRWPANHQKLEERHRTDPSSQPRQEPAQPTPWSWTSNLQKFEKINLCHLSKAVCKTLLQQL